MPLEKKIVSKRHLRRKIERKLKAMLTSCNISKNSDISTQLNLKDKKKFVFQTVAKIDQINCESNFINIELLSDNKINYENTLGRSSINENKSNSDNNVHNSDVFIVNEDDISSTSITDFNMEAHSSCANTVVTGYTPAHDSNENIFECNNGIKYATFNTSNLRNWALRYNITHTALDELLQMLKQTYNYLPLTARSLLKTPKQTKIFTLNNGDMCYFGIEMKLKQKLERGLKNVLVDNVIELDFNIDGLPLFKSSSTEVWPILLRSDMLTDDSPCMIGLFCGRGKPDPLELFLHDFIKEINFLILNNIEYEDSVFKIKIRSFICDAPARAMLKMIMGHTSKHACEKCCIVAKTEALNKGHNKFSKFHSKRKLYYPVKKEYKERKNSDFSLNQISSLNCTHIKGISPLLKIKDIGLVTQFPLDPMHLIYLGVVKRIIVNYFIEGKRKCKLSKGNLAHMNCLMKQLQKYVSNEFARKPRSFMEIKRWKALEFRNFIIYLFPIVMYNNLDSKRYNHLLLLHIAVTILCSKTLIASYLHIAKQGIFQLVQQSATIYGPCFVVYNVHSLLHICKDVEMYGPLESFSCFPYENYLGKIKRLVRGTRLPLQQIANRITELDSSSLNCSIQTKYIPKQIIHESQNNNSLKYSILITPRFKLSVKRPNNIISVYNKIVEIKHIICIEGRYKCIGTPFRYMHDLYNTLISSSRLGIFFVHGYDLSITFFVEEINYKCLLFPFKKGYAAFPINQQGNK